MVGDEKTLEIKGECSEKKKGVLDRLIAVISSIFEPVIPTLVAAGVLKGILLLFTAVGILDTTSGTYQILYALADGLYYFLPVFLAFSAGKKFGVNPYTGVMVSVALLYPEFTALLTGADALTFLGIPVKGVNYPSSFLPIFMAMLLLAKIEPFFKKRLPTLINGFGVPLCSAAIVYVVTITVFGPIGAIIAGFLANTYETVYNINTAVAGFLLAAANQPMVICGFHWGLIPICLQNIATLGKDTLLPILGPGCFAQAGAAFAVGLKLKDPKMKSNGFTGGITALFGATEAALFGCNIPLKTPFIAGCCAAAFGGILVGMSGVTAKAFAFPSLVTLPVFIGSGFGLFVAGLTVSFVLGFIFTMLTLKEHKED